MVDFKVGQEYTTLTSLGHTVVFKVVSPEWDEGMIWVKVLYAPNESGYYIGRRMTIHPESVLGLNSRLYVPKRKKHPLTNIFQNA